MKLYVGCQNFWVSFAFCLFCKIPPHSVGVVRPLAQQVQVYTVGGWGVVKKKYMHVCQLAAGHFNYLMNAVSVAARYGACLAWETWHRMRACPNAITAVGGGFMIEDKLICYSLSSGGTMALWRTMAPKRRPCLFAQVETWCQSSSPGDREVNYLVIGGCFSGNNVCVLYWSSIKGGGGC